MSDTRGRGQTRPSRGSSRGRVINSNPTAIPSGSVSKIKAQLRQTKRLLLKQDLNPDVKITSERRLVALQDELVKAEKGLLEKKMVTKYRGVKFFERQKVLRRIKQAKKCVESEKDEVKLEESRKQLFDARMDLYYILRYPKTEKYLALYPENTYIPFFTTSSSSSNTSITPSDPSSSTSSSATPSESDRKRWELRNEIRKRVSQGSWAEESEGGDLGIEGEEEEDEELQPVVVVVGEKRGRVEEGAEGGEKVESKKKRKVTEEKKEDVVELQEEKEMGVEEDKEGGEPKPLNRKQKKALKKALEAEAGAPTQTQGLAPQASTTTPTEEGEEEGEQVGLEEDGDVEGKKLNRKQKKALKRAQEAGQVQASPVKPTAPVVGKKQDPVNGKKSAPVKKMVEKKKEPESKAEKLAMEDDFFA